MDIFRHPTGPLMRYENGVLHVEDSETKIQWRMSRGELLRVGLKFMRIAITSKVEDKR